MGKSGRILPALYAVVALVIGLLLAAGFSLPCEGRGFCGALDRYGGYVLLIVLPPTAVIAAAWAASVRARRWILHATFAGVVVLVPSVTLLLAELVNRRR